MKNWIIKLLGGYTPAAHFQYGHAEFMRGVAMGTAGSPCAPKTTTMFKAVRKKK